MAQRWIDESGEKDTGILSRLAKKVSEAETQPEKTEKVTTVPSTTVPSTTPTPPTVPSTTPPIRYSNTTHLAPNRILLDADGVLLDFVGAVVCRLFNIHHTHKELDWFYNKWSKDHGGVYDLHISLNTVLPEDNQLTERELWQFISTQGEDFWTELPLYEWGRELMSLCQDYAPTYICTSPTLDPRCASGKIKSFQRVWGAGFRNYIIGPPKYLASRPGHVLIDDSDYQCATFYDAGIDGNHGAALLFPQPWNSSMWGPHLRKVGTVLEYVEKQLKVLIKQVTEGEKQGG